MIVGQAPELPPGEGERIIRYQQGAYLSRRSWKLGHLYLTDKRLLFRQVKRMILDVPLENITAVGFRKRPFILATKTCMSLSYRDGGSGRLREATIITAHLGSWYERIAELLAERGIEPKVQGVLTERHVAQARRDRVREILDEIHTGQRKTPPRAHPDRSQPLEGSEKARDVAQAHCNHVRLGDLLAELEAEEGNGARRGTSQKGDLGRPRRYGAQSNLAFGESREAIRARLDRARDSELASIRGEAPIRDVEGVAPSRARDIAQARRDRVKEILAKAHGDGPERIEDEHVAKVAQALDPASGEIIWYLWENRHAKIEELRELLGESSHMNVLTRIKEVINPGARKILSRPLLVFERSRIDYDTGENVLYSWWLGKEAERRPGQEGKLVDVFDEGDHVMVIMELAGVREEDIQVKVERDKVIVEADTPEHRCCEEVTLPSAVDAAHFTTRYHNSIFQARFEKAPQVEPLGGGL